MNTNRFCLFLLLTTLICIIAGIFLVFTSLHYNGKQEQEIRTEVRREAGKMSPHTVEERPVFPDDYHASGLLILPHSSIAEPFEIWFSTTLGASRIDYYYGTDKSFQRGDEGDYGKYYKVVPMYNDKQGNFEGCWTVEGTKYRPIFAQTVIPNMTWFKYVETEVYTGTLATKWHYEYWAYGMLNSQYVWVTKSKPYKPIRYEMKGYDAMLGSYYDHYVLEYVTFEKWRPQMKRLEMRPNIHCFNWSLTLESSLIANPMQEFTPFSAEHLVDVDDMYKDYKNNHGKIYNNDKEHKERKHIYKHNMRFIRSMNRKKNHFKLSSNHFTDLSDDEFEAHLGSITKADSRNHTGMKQLHKHKPVYVGQPPSAIEIPEQLDWRDFGAVSQVKGQGICGSCYTFSASGAAEGAHFLKTGNLVELSSQQILDCSWGSGNHGCKGGHYAAALSFLYLHGAATLNSYGKYLAQEGVCHFNDTLLGAKPDAFAYVPSFNNTALKRSVAKFGPAAISINVSPLSFKFYSGGIYHDPDCWSNRTRHSALVIGYGSEHGKEYWIVKNSWSDTWGEKGYMRVAMDGNACGVTEAPVVALVNHVTFQFPVKEKITSMDSGDQVGLGRKVKAVTRKKKVVDKMKKKTRKSSKRNRNKAQLNAEIPKFEGEDTEASDEKIRLQPNDKLKNGQNSEHVESFKEEQSSNVDAHQKQELQFQLKSSQSLNNIDDKEIPKIEPHNEKHDIGALGDTIAVGESGGLAKEDVSITSKSDTRDKIRTDDFKLPVLQMSVDQSKLPMALAEHTKDPADGSNPEASTEIERGNNRINSASLLNSSIKKPDTRIKNSEKDKGNVSATKNRNHGMKSNEKKTNKPRKNIRNIKKSTFLMKTKNWLSSIHTIDKKSVIDGAENDQPKVNSDGLQNVLQYTMSDLYAKIDRALISAKKG